MASSAPTPGSSPARLTPEEQQRAEQYKAAIHYTALGSLIVCPLLIFIPPRTPVRTSLLLLATGIGGNQLADEYSGVSLVQRAANRVQYIAGTDLPPKAQAMQMRLREERHAQQQQQQREQQQQAPISGGSVDRVEPKKSGAALEESQKKERGVLGKLWMGEEDENWKQKRDEKEKEALEEGRGYGGLIMDQIWEVWNWGKKEAEEVKEKDEEVIRARKEKK